jgi:hypothetical protein
VRKLVIQSTSCLHEFNPTFSRTYSKSDAYLFPRTTALGFPNTKQDWRLCGSSKRVAADNGGLVESFACQSEQIERLWLSKIPRQESITYPGLELCGFRVPHLHWERRVDIILKTLWHFPPGGGRSHLRDRGTNSSRSIKSVAVASQQVDSLSVMPQSGILLRLSI